MKLKWVILSVMACMVGMVNMSNASESSVNAALHKKFPKMSSTTTPKKIKDVNLYEMRVAGVRAYTDEDVSFVLVGGDLLVGGGGGIRNLTHIGDEVALNEPAKNKVALSQAEVFAKLPFNMAIKTVYGNGARKIAVFADPDCPFCQKLEAMFTKNADKVNATVYTFLWPLSIHPNSMQKATFFMCSSDPSSLYNNWMNYSESYSPPPMNQHLTAWDSWYQSNQGKSSLSCNKSMPMVEITKLAESYGLTMTPTLIFENGMVWNGGMDIYKLLQAYQYFDKK